MAIELPPSRGGDLLLPEAFIPCNIAEGAGWVLLMVFAAIVLFVGVGMIRAATVAAISNLPEYQGVCSDLSNAEGIEVG
jgi:hypothetical protein